MATAIIGDKRRLGGISATVVDSLPATGQSNKIYFVPNQETSEDNRYDEYIWIKDTDHPDGVWEKVGYKYLDLSQYYNKDEVDQIVSKKLDNDDFELFQTAVDNHINNKSNPHEVTKEQVGLGNVDNTSDLDKPISTVTQTALDKKANQATTIAGYGITDASLDSNGIIVLGDNSIQPMSEDDINALFV